MDNIDKSTLMKIVFGFTALMFIIIFLLILSTKDNKDNNKENNINNSENSSEEVLDNNNTEEDNEEDNSGFTFDFQRIKNDSSCLGSTSCDFIIGTISENETTKLLGYKLLNNKHSILIEDNVIYEEENDFYINEFISFEDYLILLKEKEEMKVLTLIGKDGNKILSDEYIKGDIYINENITYKSLNCADGYIYENEIKVINGRPKIIIDSSTGEKSSETCK